MSIGKKKPKPRHRRPPLSPLDRFLYWVLFFLGILLLFSIIVLFVIWQQQVGKANGAIAVESTASILLLLIPLFPAIVVGAILFETGYLGRIPIIPSRSAVLSKPQSRRSNAKAKILLIVLAAMLWVGSFIPAIGAVYNRTEINATHIDTYAMFGRLEEHRSVEDAASVHVRIFYGSGGRYTYKWQMSYTISFSDGETFYFKKMPSVMIEIDKLFPDMPKTVEGAEHFDALCDEYDCTADERKQLKALLLIDDSI